MRDAPLGVGVGARYETIEGWNNGTEFVWSIEGEEATGLVELELNRVLGGARR